MEKSIFLPSELISRNEFSTRFDHQVNENRFEILVHIIPINLGIFAIQIFADRNFVGLIAGTLSNDSDNKTTFTVHDSHNFTKHKSQADHIPGVVGATVAHLVSSGLVNEWYSDIESKLSPDAKKMYGEYLAGDSRLKVDHPTEQIQRRYVVTASKIS